MWLASRFSLTIGWGVTFLGAITFSLPMVGWVVVAGAATFAVEAFRAVTVPSLNSYDGHSLKLVALVVGEALFGIMLFELAMPYFWAYMGLSLIGSLVAYLIDAVLAGYAL
jgi:hypothetical protein